MLESFCFVIPGLANTKSRKHVRENHDERTAVYLLAQKLVANGARAVTLVEHIGTIVFGPVFDECFQ